MAESTDEARITAIRAALEAACPGYIPDPDNPGPAGMSDSFAAFARAVRETNDNYAKVAMNGVPLLLATIDSLRRKRTALDRVEDAARGWAVAWDATHGKALPMPLTLDQREMLRRRDVAEENLREAIRALAAVTIPWT